MTSPRASRSGETEAIILIKAAPQVGQRHGETVCCAGIGLDGQWLRLYPVSFRNLDDGQKFGRWDRVRFRWRMPTDDQRAESRRIDQDSVTITGNLKKSERERFLANLITTSLDKEREAGRSLALLKARDFHFKIEKRTQAEIVEDQARFDALRAQPDLFNTKPIIPYTPCPYKFKYKYRTDDGDREGTCQDWEIEATYFNWSKQYGEDEAIKMIQKTFGCEYPEKGMLLDQEPLTYEHLNQLLILSHEAGLSYAFYQYYWLTVPDSDHTHPYDVTSLQNFSDAFRRSNGFITSAQHLAWGLERLYVDSLLFFGNVREGYRRLRNKDSGELREFFRSKSYNTHSLLERGAPLPLELIARDDRYLIAEVACKTYDAPAFSDLRNFLSERLAELKALHVPKITARALLKIKQDEDSEFGAQLQFNLDSAAFSLDDILDKEIAVVPLEIL